MALCKGKLNTWRAAALTTGLLFLPSSASAASGEPQQCEKPNAAHPSSCVISTVDIGADQHELVGPGVTCFSAGTCTQVSAASCAAAGGANAGDTLTCSDPMVFLDDTGALGDGSYQSPFPLLALAVGGAPSGAIVRIKTSGTYAAPGQILDKPLKLINQSNGPAILGPYVCQSASDCDDGNACTTDTCHALGACFHAHKVCADPCIGAQCDPATGGCGPVLPVGTSCSDGDACTFGDSCFYGTCSGTACAAGETCCPGLACATLAADMNNCGACGNVCPTNTVCVQSACVNGCQISGVGYPHGSANPANECEVCDTAFSRTSWKFASGNACARNCVSGVCQNNILADRGCLTLGGGFLCQDTPCQDSQCVNNQCIITPLNEGQGCGVLVQGGDCRSATSGTCRSGTCLGSPTNEGGACSVNLVTTQCFVPGAGTCQSGTCVGVPQNAGVSCLNPGPWPTPAGPLGNPPGGECYSTTHGECDGSGHCRHDVFLGAPCTVRGSSACFSGTCELTTYNPDFDIHPFPHCGDTEQIVCPQPHQLCGLNGSTDPDTCECVYPAITVPNGAVDCHPIFGTLDPMNTGWLCCPGQVCICDPRDVSGFCSLQVCWDPADLE